MTRLIACPLCQKKNFQSVFIKGKRQVVKCFNDGLVFVNPQPSKKKLAQLYGPDYFQGQNPYLKAEQVNLRYFRRKLNQIEKRVIKVGKLLDIGCGWGFLLLEAKKRNWQGLGIDVADYALDYCRKKGLKVKKEKTSLSAGSFDVITSFQTIEHETNPLAHLREIYRLLKPGGLMLLSTPNYNSWTRKLMGKYWFGYRHKEHLYFLASGVLREMLRKIGFRRFEICRDDIRIFTLGYYLTRLTDFYTCRFGKRAMNVIKEIIGNLSIPIPTVPGGDILVFAWK